MNKLQQAANDYGDPNPNVREGIMQERAFLAGAAYAAGAFAEWCSSHGTYEYEPSVDKWRHIDGDGQLSTAELYQLWQQSL